MDFDIDNLLKSCETSAILIKKACYLCLIDEISSNNLDWVPNRDVYDKSYILGIMKESVESLNFVAVNDIFQQHFKEYTHHCAKNGQYLLAKRLGVSRQLIYLLMSGKQKVSWKMAKRLQQEFGISAHKLRPDIFDEDAPHDKLT